jgi:hypothetical protein
MECAGRGWRVRVATRHSYATTPPELAFVIKYGHYSQEVHGSVKDAEERMCQIIHDLRREQLLDSHNDNSIIVSIVFAIVCGAMFGWAYKYISA